MELILKKLLFFSTITFSTFYSHALQLTKVAVWYHFNNINLISYTGKLEYNDSASSEILTAIITVVRDGALAIGWKDKINTTDERKKLLVKIGTTYTKEKWYDILRTTQLDIEKKKPIDIEEKKTTKRLGSEYVSIMKYKVEPPLQL